VRALKAQPKVRVCHQCEHVWPFRIGQPTPLVCPNCQSLRWNNRETVGRTDGLLVVLGALWIISGILASGILVA